MLQSGMAMAAKLATLLQVISHHILKKVLSYKFAVKKKIADTHYGIKALCSI